jgi:sec-independent protein translocase protein TatC
MNAQPKRGESPPSLPSMTLVEHLSELRKRLIKCFLAVLGGGLIMWFLYNPSFQWLIDVLKHTCRTAQQCEIIQTDPMQGFTTRMTFAGYGGLALAMPVILWQLWRFIMPGLYPKEKRLAFPFTFSAVLLFALGAALALWTLPKAIDFLNGVGGGNFAQFYTPDKYVNFTVKMMVAFGVGFEFPILLVFLQLVGVVSYQRLAKFRRYAIVLITVVVAVLTPSGDPISLFALVIPMILFYEISILIGRISARRKRKREAA